MSDKSKRCVLLMTFRPSQRTLFMARRNWVPLALKYSFILYVEYIQNYLIFFDKLITFTCMAFFISQFTCIILFRSVPLSIVTHTGINKQRNEMEHEFL